MFWSSSNVAEMAAIFMELWLKGSLVELYTAALGSPKDALIPPPWTEGHPRPGKQLLQPAGAS